jgi:glyoxylate carboligase
VFEVIIQIAESIDAKLVLKKAQNNLQTHRTPVMCEAVLETIQRIGIASTPTLSS